MQMGNADNPQPNAWADCGSEHKMFAWGPTAPGAGGQSIANRQEESELAARQGKILDLKNLKKNVSHFLVLKDWQKNLVTF